MAYTEYYDYASGGLKGAMERIATMRMGRLQTPPADMAVEFDRTRQIGFLTRKMYQKNQALWADQIGDDISSAQASILVILLEEGPLSLTEAGRAAAMDPATTRGVVDRLKQRGLVSVTSDRKDRRKVIVKLKPKGRTTIETIQPLLPVVADATYAPLNIAERLALEFLLLKATSGEAGA
jgi:DNA-binding MarR family transcriptional regulator